MFKNISYLVLFTVFTSVAFGQADPSFRRNQFSALLINPAQAGANAKDEISIIAGKSLVGFTGAPQTVSALGNFRLFKNMGIGTACYNDQLGPITTNRASLDFAYHLKVNKNFRISMGLRGAISNVSVDLPSLTTTVLNDPHMQGVLNSGTRLDAGWGLLAYSKHLYFGLAQPRIFNTKFTNANLTQVTEGKSFVAYAGGDVRLSNEWVLRPVGMLRYIKGLPIMLDISATGTYRKMLDIGLNYQLGSSVGIIAGHEVNQKLYVGYNYNYPLSGLNRVSSQSHELVLRLKLGQGNSSKFQGPRFFN
jgi:type IX secretion system PorP/SprF family membrane protein